MKAKFKIPALVDAVFNSYSTILFSNERIVGFLILVSTLIDWKTGLSGLVGVTISLTFARIFKFEGWESRSGLLGFNSLLVTLGLGYFYPSSGFNPLIFCSLLVIGSILTMLTFVALNSIITRYLNFPSMSLSFSFIAIFFSFFYLRIGGTLIGEARALIFPISLEIPQFIELYFKSLGSIFFQPNIVTGALIAIALLITTRIGFVLSLVGYSLSFIFMTVFNNFPTGEILFPSLNLILISIAIGGVFFVPGWYSYLIALVAGITGIIIAFSFQTMLYNFFVPPFAFPYCITVFIYVYAMRLRLVNKNPYSIDYGAFHPEGNLEYYYSRIDRFYETGTSQFALPFSGEWVITQGNDGEFTHKDLWKHAWDFEMQDKEGKKYRNEGINANDYFCYGKPVLASAPGYVAKVLDGVPDNPIGQINTTDNWGNYVIVHHWGSIYSMYAHLKPGTINLKLGDYIGKGTKIGSVGNTGRSEVPHLHFNIQLGPEPGSSTLKSYLVNYKKTQDTMNYEFTPYGIPLKDDLISPLIPDYSLQDLLRFKVKDSYVFNKKVASGTTKENWEVNVDLLGNLSITSDNKSYIYFSIYEGIYNCFSYYGNRCTCLHAFAILLSRLPYLKGKSIEWNDKPPLSIFYSPFMEKSILFLKAFMPGFITTEANYKAVDNKGVLEIQSFINLKIFNKVFRKYTGTIEISQENGISRMCLDKNGENLIEVERTE